MQPPSPIVRILVVDDEAVIRHSFQDHLEDIGYEVITADNGQTAIELIRQSPPDLVLTDLRMPVMNGLDLIRQSRQLAPDLPIIVISGAGVIGDAIQALRLGAYDYLIKPVAGQDILEHTIDQALENTRLIRENRNYQEHLESLVNERTQELDDINTKLANINARLRKIVDTARGFSTCKDVDSLTSRILDEFADHMSAAGGSFYIVHEEGLRRTHVIDEGHTAEFIPFPLAVHSVFHQILKSGKPLLIQDISSQPDLSPSGWEAYRDASLLAFPLLRKDGAVMGLLTLHGKASAPFAEEDKEIGTILASYSSEAIQSVSVTEILRVSEQRFRELADMLPLTICEIDTQGLITYTNRQACQSFGYRDTDLSGMNITDIVTPEYHDKVTSNSTKIMRELRANTEGNEYQALRKDGTTFPILTYSSPIVSNGNVIGIRTAAVDISLLKSQQEQILRHAHFDSLTQLPNRFLVLDRLSQLIKEARRTGTQVAVLFLDLDDFKKINDTLGHDTGDRLLIQAAERLNQSLRDGDTVGRLGGDEFVVLLGGLNTPDDARPVAVSILQQFRQVFQLNGRDLLLTCSLGIAIYPTDSQTPNELLRNADSAMYFSKDEGRNTFNYYTKDMNSAAQRRLLLEEHLHGALERNELYIHFQPLVDTRNLKVVGAEALLRWHSPVLGQISPDEFVPVLEQTGQIIPVGRHVLRVALELTAQWRESRDFTIAVNLSPRQFRDPSLLTYVNELLESNQLPGDTLELEITEGVLMSANVFVEHLLTDLSEAGIKLSMDDFGTGYSSLSYLRNYPFNTLKIDRSFIQDISTDPADRELVNAAITMGRNLGLNVIAEGVETQEQLEILRSLDCNLAQGYLFSQPVSADSFTDLLANMNEL
ncbi:MAG: EAL domain-containing protein [Candidatus Thiodiazotropha sp.]